MWICVYNHRIPSALVWWSAAGTVDPPLETKGRGYIQGVSFSCVRLWPAAVLCVHVAAARMSLNTVGTALTRTVWTRGNRTPPFMRSPKVNRLSTTCWVSGERKQGREKTKEKSCGSCTDGPREDVPTSSEPPHRCTAGDKKRPQEPLGAPGVTGVRRRSYTSTAVPVDQKSYMWARYNDTKRLVHGKQRVTASQWTLRVQRQWCLCPVAVCDDMLFIRWLRVSSFQVATQDGRPTNAAGSSMPDAF